MWRRRRRGAPTRAEERRFRGEQGRARAEALRSTARLLRGRAGLTDAALGRLLGVTGDRLRRLCRPTPAEEAAELRRRVRGTR